MFQNFNLLKFFWQQRQRQSFSKSVWNLVSVKQPVKTKFQPVKICLTVKAKTKLKIQCVKQPVKLKFHFLLENPSFQNVKDSIELGST